MLYPFSTQSNHFSVQENRAYSYAVAGDRFIPLLLGPRPHEIGDSTTAINTNQAPPAGREPYQPPDSLAGLYSTSEEPNKWQHNNERSSCDPAAYLEGRSIRYD